MNEIRLMQTEHQNNQETDFERANLESGIQSPKSILVACIGNIFLGDDGFGCEVAKVLQTKKLPENVKLFDYSIRGYDLAYALVDGYDVTIFVDAVPNREMPGTVYVIEPDISEFEKTEASIAMLDAHTMNPLHVLRMAYQMGAKFKKLLLVGCEPETLGGEEGQMGLSEPVQAAVEKAVEIIERLVENVLTENQDRAAA